MDNTDWKEKIVQLRKRDRLRRANAIHLHCVDCVGYELYAVTKCTCYHCPLWEWRTGAYTPFVKHEEISGGTLKIGDKVMNDVEPKDRDIAMVFQNYALYPHMTVYDNMAFGLKLRKVPKDQIDKAVREAARILDLEKLLDRKPKALSGGQRQRVAMGRAIVRNPKVFLMDEPL